MAWVVGCDTGGTFTDLVALSGEGEMRIAKVPSTPPDFHKGVLAGLEQLGLDPDEVQLLFHGTTVTTNAVVQKKGARTALVTTAGFRDVLEIRRANREELYDILWDPPPPLVPRRNRFEVSERVDYAGNVVRPLDPGSVKEVAAKIKAREIESVAVCLINAHMNPKHEQEVREILLGEIPDLDISLSTDILPEPPEFERTATTVANAYTAPVLRRYMRELEGSLQGAGYGGDIVLVMHNGGGTMATDYAMGHAVKTLNSGPAAGVIAGAAVARHMDRPEAVCLDMGGTSCELALVSGGEPRLTTSFDLEWGMPIRFPSVDVISIGAGGGSIGWLDQAGKPRSGPHSAGADPGPACYGRGGSEPTNTDAQLVLGRISNERFLDGRMSLDRDLAAEAIKTRLADPLGLSLEEAAAGLLRIANTNMVSAIRLITVERGFDPREFSLISFGGAGPLHAVEIARELNMREVVVPVHPGVTSALGLLFVDPLDDFSWAYVRHQDEVDFTDLRAAFASISERVYANLERQGIARDSVEVESSVDLRYIGQLHSITVPLAEVTQAGFDEAVATFHTEHMRQYRYSHPENPVEISTIRVTAKADRSKPDLGRVRRNGHGGSSDGAAAKDRRVYFQETGWTEVPVAQRSSLSAGTELEGPMVIEDIDTTIVVPPRTKGQVAESGEIVLTLAD